MLRSSKKARGMRRGEDRRVRGGREGGKERGRGASIGEQEAGRSWEGGERREGEERVALIGTCTEYNMYWHLLEARKEVKQWDKRAHHCSNAPSLKQAVIQGGREAMGQAETDKGLVLEVEIWTRNWYLKKCKYVLD